MWKKVILLLVIQMTYNWKIILSGPTVTPVNPFTPESDAEKLRDATDCYGTKENKISEILCRRPYWQRAEITVVFQQKYQTPLSDVLEDETSGDLLKIYRRLLLSPGAVLGNDLHATIEGKRTDYGAVTEIICGSDNFDKTLIGSFYIEKYQKSVTAHAADKYKKDKKEYHFALSEFCWRIYNETQILTLAQADEIAAKLSAISPQEQKENFKLELQSILRIYGIYDLRLIFERYRSRANCLLEDAINQAMKDEEAEAYSTLVRSMENRHRYYASLLHEAVDGGGTDEDRVNRILVCQCEKDLGNILDEYKCLYGKSFRKRLGGWFGDTAGYRNRHYFTALDYLLGG